MSSVELGWVVLERVELGSVGERDELSCVVLERELNWVVLAVLERESSWVVCVSLGWRRTWVVDWVVLGYLG